MERATCMNLLDCVIERGDDCNDGKDMMTLMDNAVGSRQVKERSDRSSHGVSRSGAYLVNTYLVLLCSQSVLVFRKVQYPNKPKS